jgi:hypothetical protein
MSVNLHKVFVVNAEPFRLELLLNGAKKHTFQANEGGMVDGIEFDQVGLEMPIIGWQVHSQNPDNSVGVTAGSNGTFTMVKGERSIVLQYHTTGGETNTVRFVM